MRTPANNGAGHRRSRWRGRDNRPDDTAGRPGQTGGADAGGADSVRRGVGSARSRPAEPADSRGSGPHQGLGWDLASRAAVSRRQALRQRDGADLAAGGRPDQDPASVFAPDFARTGPDPARPDPGRLEAAGIIRTSAGGAAAPRSWYENGTAGKGPVRGYPPAPGQPLPLYPPGQFAAWNRRRDGRTARGGPGSPEASQAADDLAQPLAGLLARDESGDSASGPLSRYYARDTDPGADPGYPTLAVSDPAADVTSTQTWQALADGRATGIWAAPAALRGGATGQAAPGAPPGSRALPVTRPGAGRPAQSGAHTALSRTAGTAPKDTGGAVANLTISAGDGSQPGTRPASGRHGGPQTGPQSNLRQAGPGGDARSPRSERAAPAAVGRPGADRADPPSQAGHERGRLGNRAGRPRRGRPVSVHLAIAAAALLILAAAGTLGYTVLHDSAKPRPASQSSGKKAASASPSPSLGYGDIASRQTDPQPLTVAELYPASFTVAGTTVTSAATSLGSTCASAIVGATLQSAVGAAGCTQVARATYVDPAGIMATVGVLNLSTGDSAKTAAQAADASDYISQLAATTGPASKIGQGTGIEEAAAKGHYLILIWAELTNQATPSAQQTAQIETFMTWLLKYTVNQDLTTRMLTGAP